VHHLRHRDMMPRSLKYLINLAYPRGKRGTLEQDLVTTWFNSANHVPKPISILEQDNPPWHPVRFTNSSPSRSRR